MRERKVESVMTTSMEKSKRGNVLLKFMVILLSVYCLFLTFAYFGYKRPDLRDLLFLTQCDSEASVIEYFGRRPEIIYYKHDTMPRLGWKLPSRSISNRVLVYTNKSALRFYIYIDENGRVEYVFTSHS